MHPGWSLLGCGRNLHPGPCLGGWGLPQATSLLWVTPTPPQVQPGLYSMSRVEGVKGF